jgi:hypothetical protein
LFVIPQGSAVAVALLFVIPQGSAVVFALAVAFLVCHPQRGISFSHSAATCPIHSSFPIRHNSSIPP